MRLALALALVLILVPLPGTATARGATRAQCAPRGAETVLRTARVELVHRTDERRDEERTWGCMAPRWKRFLILADPCLSDHGCLGLPPHLVAAGKYVGFQAPGCLRSECGSTVGVVSLRTGRRSETPNTGFGSTGPVVTTRGTIAWVDVGEYPQGGRFAPGKRVRAMAFGGPVATLDEGEEIEPESLALGGSTLYWTKAGAPRSAGLH